MTKQDKQLMLLIHGQRAVIDDVFWVMRALKLLKARITQKTWLDQVESTGAGP